MSAFVEAVLGSSWELLLDSAIYVLFGVGVAALIKGSLSAETVARHLGRGRVGPVLKASVLGIPLPLCSCGVVPAAAALKRQGASRGATTSFLISTPESGVDSIVLTYALFGPVMAVARPVAAFVAATVAGLTEVWLGRADDPEPDAAAGAIDAAAPVEVPPVAPSSRLGRAFSGLRFAVVELWADIAVWFFAGLLVAGVVTALVPEDVMARHLGGGLGAMLVMLVVGVPLYVCATSSTPIAAALVLHGLSPGAALVFLLAGPATNLTTMTVLLPVLGRRALVIYVASISIVAVASGLALDAVLGLTGVSLQASMGHAGELLPGWLHLAGVVALLAISIRPIGAWARDRATSLRRRFGRAAPAEAPS